MYNLFVTADTQAWNEANGSYEFTRSRFLEHTEDKLVRTRISLRNKLRK